MSSFGTQPLCHLAPWTLTLAIPTKVSAEGQHRHPACERVSLQVTPGDVLAPPPLTPSGAEKQCSVLLKTQTTFIT